MRGGCKQQIPLNAGAGSHCAVAKQHGIPRQQLGAFLSTTVVHFVAKYFTGPERDLSQLQKQHLSRHRDFNMNRMDRR